jgi:hypothetical protein
MTDVPPSAPRSDGADEIATPGVSPEADSGTGFSSAEKIIGAAAAYQAPLVSGLAASELARNETDPVRRRQLTVFRNASFAWWGVGILVAIIGLVVVVSFASSHGAGGSCRGGPDKFDATGVTYQSTDGKHWTATYPCVRGGSTTIPVPRRQVP